MRAGRGLCLVLACLVLSGCAGSSNATNAPGSGGGKGGRRGGGGDVPVTVVKVERRNVPVDLAVIGNVEACDGGSTIRRGDCIDNPTRTLIVG